VSTRFGADSASSVGTIGPVSRRAVRVVAWLKLVVSVRASRVCD